MIFFHHSMTEAPTPIRISHGPKIPKPFQSKSGSPFEVGTEPPTPIRISHRWKINPISSKSEIIGAQKLTVEPIFMVARCGFFLVQKRLFWKENPEPKKSKSGSDELMILLVIWAFFPSPVCICHWCISIGWLHQTLENVMAITSFCPIDISHSSIGIRVGLRKVARVVSIGIVTSHILQKKKEVGDFFCVCLGVFLEMKSLLLLWPFWCQQAPCARKSAWKLKKQGRGSIFYSIRRLSIHTSMTFFCKEIATFKVP